MDKCRLPTIPPPASITTDVSTNASSAFHIDISGDEPKPAPKPRIGHIAANVISVIIILASAAAICIASARMLFSQGLSSSSVASGFYKLFLGAALPDTSHPPFEGLVSFLSWESADSSSDTTETDSDTSAEESASDSEAEAPSTSIEPESDLSASDESEPLPKETSKDITDTLAPTVDTESPTPPYDKVISVDMSESHLGMFHLNNSTIYTPNVNALIKDAQDIFSSPPAVLIVCSRPYEKYRDRTQGVATQARYLARALSERGIDSIFAEPPSSKDTSAEEIYAQTKAIINYYTSLYPQIGLVIDVGRGSELSEDGSIIRTKGELDGTECSQISVICHTRGCSPKQRDNNLSFALSLRARLFDISPTLSRPVHLSEDGGLITQGPLMLSVEIGTVGNCTEESEKATKALEDALISLLLDS